MKISQIVESATVAGSIASVASPLGATQSRSQKPPKAPKVAKAKKYANVISEGKMKELAYDLEHMDPGNFKKKYGKTKEEVKASLSEAKVEEAEVLVVPGMRRMKDKSFISHKEDRRDHEVEMARSELFAAAKDAQRIYAMLKSRTEDEGLMGWQQSYITLAADYLNSVADSLEHQAHTNEMTGGVLAGGMSNAEESKVNELKSSTINDYISKSSAAVRGGRKELPKKVPSWKVAAGKVNPDSVMGKYAKVKAGDLQGVAEGSEILKVGTAVRVPHKGKMVPGKIIRYDSGKGGESPAYVVDIGEYESKIVPVHNMKQGVAEGRYGRYYDPMGDERREQDAMDQERRDFKRREMEYELRNEPKNNYQVNIDGKSWKVFASKEQAEKAARTIERKYNKKATVHLTGAAPTNEAKAHKCPECGGEMVSEELMNEKKDACYYKVKSRYKVWPSAYASGALVKCRKKGASNWGNKSKK